MSVVRWTGNLADLPPSGVKALLDRSFSNDPGVTDTVRGLIHEVRTKGDAALVELARRFDRVELARLEVPRAELDRALGQLDPAVRRGLERASRNLEAVARATLPPPSEVEVEPGVVVGRRADPFNRVGVYAPGGKAAYPSSVLMGVVPARAAGVPEVVVCSPPGPSGLPSDVVLAAAALAGASRVFAVGGAGAIAALAYGTPTIRKVDRIVGPGNAWVAEAKRQVAGDVGIDSPAGPSEILVLADAAADPGVIARELLAQAEHDVDACCVALVPTTSLASAVLAALEAALPGQARRTIIEQALGSRGAVLVTSSLEEGVSFANDFAAEHLQLAMRDPGGVLPRIRNAGTIFVGEPASVAFGDYVTGANHVLPTAGAGRRFSGLSVLDFVRWATWQRVTPAAARSFAADVGPLTAAEGLPAHGAAAAHWLDAVDVPAPAPVVRLKPTLRSIARYVPTRPPCDIDLTDNTNLFGLPPGVQRVLQTLPSEAVTRYPSPYAEVLRAALAREAGVGPESVVTGCGSDDVIDAAVRAFGEPGDVLAYCPPTFSIVPTFARANGLVPEAVPLELGALLRSRARLIYLCTPNNPTGGVLPEGLLDGLLARTSAVVLLDEAYADFSRVPSRLREAAASPRLVVLRTMSKAFGLAGLRVGWGVASPTLVGELEKTRGPYKVGNLAERAAVAALTVDREWVQGVVKETIALRQRLLEALVAAGFRPLPGEGNFLLVPVARPADGVAAAMRERGVSVRAFPGLPGLGETVRITVGPWPLLEQAVAALKEATT
jgi:histidinol dehydrogenase